jgi:hypothetical protein
LAGRARELGAFEDQPDNSSSAYLGNLDQVIVALGKTIRAMADGTPDSQAGGRICNGLGILVFALRLRQWSGASQDRRCG